MHGAFNELLDAFDIRCEENGREIRVLGAFFAGKSRLNTIVATNSSRQLYVWSLRSEKEKYFFANEKFFTAFSVIIKNFFSPCSMVDWQAKRVKRHEPRSM